MLTRRLLPRAVVASIVLGSLSAAPASAGTSIGQTPAPVFTCSAGNTFAVTAASYRVPASGVITSWRFPAVSPVPTIKLKVFRPGGGSSYTVVGASDAVTPTAGSVNSFLVRIPVAAGDTIGLTFLTGGLCGTDQNNSVYVAGDAPVGSTQSYQSSETAVPNVGATVEPDVDADGYGDETQDGCPSGGTQQGACDTTPPETTFTKGPTRTAKSKVTFGFTSSEAGSRFECKIKGPGITRIELKTFQPCTSPKKYTRLRVGTFRVFARATDVAGNVDPTPAKVKLKVVRRS